MIFLHACSQFIKKHNDIFGLVDGMVVSLKAHPIPTNEEKQSSDEPTKNDSHIPDKATNQNYSAVDTSNNAPLEVDEKQNTKR